MVISRSRLLIAGFGLSCALLVLMLIPAISQHQPYKLVCDIWPPYQMDTADGVTGFSTELVQAVFSRMDVTTEPVQGYPWKRAMSILEHGRADGLFSANLTEDRKLFALYPDEPLFESPWILWTPDSSKISTLDDLKGKTVGVVAGYSYTPEFWAFIETFCTVETVSSDEINLKKLAYRRLDATVTEYGNGYHLARTFKLDSIKPHPDIVIKTDGLYIMFNKTNVSESFVGRFSDELRRFKTTAAYRALRHKYFGKEPE